MSDVEDAMAKRSTDELRAICTDDAPDYTAEALAAARAELARRGEDTSGLVPSTRAPTEPRNEARSGAVGLVLVLGAAMAIAPLTTSLPSWALILIESALGAAAIVTAMQTWSK